MPRRLWIRFAKAVVIALVCVVIAFNSDGTLCIVASLTAIGTLAGTAIKAVL